MMNFFGNSLHVNQEKPDSNSGHLTRPTYDFRYKEFKNGDGQGYEIVDPTSRKSYKTWYVEIIDLVDFNASCKDATSFNARPKDVNADAWPTKCDEVVGINGGKIKDALNNRPQKPSDTTNSTTVVGHMHLLGHRLGNGPLIEMIPDQTIMATQTAQKTSLTYPGCFGLAAGTRGGLIPTYHSCTSVEIG